MRDAESRLCALLAEAEKWLASSSINDAFSRLSLDEFRQLVSDSRVRIQEDLLPPEAASELWRAFAPTSDWDDLGGDPKLGDEVFELVDMIYGQPEST